MSRDLSDNTIDNISQDVVYPFFATFVYIAWFRELEPVKNLLNT